MGSETEKLKKMVIYGDSISTTNHGDGGYEFLLKQSLNLDQVYNFAVSASGLGTDTPNHMVGIISSAEYIPKDSDLILIWHGTNDWYWGTEIGIMGTTKTNTFWGGIDFVIKVLRNKVPFAKIAWITPIYRYEVPSLGTHSGEAYEMPNSKGYTLFDYYEVLERASQKYGFYFIDMRRLSNLHKGNEEYYLEDHVHPNKKGYEVISRILNKEISKIYGIE